MGCERSSYMLLRNGSKPVSTGVRTALIHRRALLICPSYPPKHEKGRNFHGDSCDERVLWIENLFYDIIHTELEITSADTGRSESLSPWHAHPLGSMGRGQDDEGFCIQNPDTKGHHWSCLLHYLSDH